jgi:lipid II:glycine glycyltransferase (peptidoglycan interpeptide bridge formation enzyme)
MKIEIINPIEYPSWDDLLLTNEQSTFFHTSAWAKVLSESYKYKPLYFTVIENGKLSTLIPIMEIKSFLTGKRGVSIPFTDQCDLIVANREQFQALLKELFKYGKRANWKHIELRGGSKYLSGTPYASTFFTHSLELTNDENDIFSSFRSSTKRNIKKAVKEGVKCKILYSLDAIKKFYRLNCMTRRHHGLPPQPFNFFRKLYENVISQPLGFIVLAHYQSKVIAAAMYFHHGNQVMYKYGASDNKYQHLRPNNLVMWEAIKWYAQNGYKEFNFGRTEPENQGLLQFKRGWGAKENKLHYYKYDIIKDTFVGEESSIKSSYGFFKILPSPLLRLTGNLLYRHVG